MRRFRPCLSIAIVALYFVASAPGMPSVDSAEALEPIALEGADVHLLGGAFEYFQNPDPSLTIQQITDPERSDPWVVSDVPTLNLGLTSAAVWIRFKVDAPSELQSEWLLDIDFPLTDLVEFYQPDSAEGYRVERAGDSLRHSAWPIPGRVPRFALDLTPGAERTYYLRLVSENTMLVPLRLATPRWIAESDANTRMWFGLFIGSLLALGVYHLFLYAYIRDINYLYYVATVAVFAMYQATYNGLFSQYIAPDSIWLKQRFLHVNGSLVAIVLYVFIRNFLKNEGTTARWKVYSRTFVRFSFLLLPLALFAPVRVFNIVVIALGFIGAAIFSVDAWKTWRAGYRPAGYFLFSWSWVGIASILFGMRSLGVIPSNFFTEHSMQFGSLITVINIAFSLSDLIRVLQQDLQVSVREKQGLLVEVQSLNRNLESRIAERTLELEEKQEQLELNYSRVSTLERKQAVSEERERIMREMHDGMGGQLISALSLVEDEGDETSDVANALRSSLEEMRLVIYSLDSNVNDITGLLGTVRERSERRLQQAGLRFRWQVTDVPEVERFGPEHFLHILRVCQEAITNALKHAEATVITVATGVETNSHGARWIFIRISDDGRGISQSSDTGYGIRNMAFRAAALNGECRVDPLDTGTRVELRFPVDQS